MGEGEQKDQKYLFIYSGIQYDATGYVHKHPGGKQFLDNMKAQRKDFTQYFKCLHSQDAQKILKSFPVVSKNQPSYDSQKYMELYQKVKHLYKPNWPLEIFLMVFVAFSFVTACFTSLWYVSILCFAFAQTISGWQAHSMAHSRDWTLHYLGKTYASLVGAFSLQWWAPKHNMHHIFTNSQLYDDDIKHSYLVVLYPFLYLKWRYDSFESAIKKRNPVDIFLISCNYLLLLYCRQNLIYFILGELLAGFFSANVLIGNHERQKRYKDPINESFLDHQTVTCRNYRQNHWIWLILMGGMQYQTQHHLFPQILFYNLPVAETILRHELKKLNKSVIYGPVL